MQLMIISLPAGEQVASLSLSLNADELFIGQSESCQIRLPDRHKRVAEQHVRLLREDNQWYVENLSDQPLRINQVEVPVRARQRLLLNDGDIIFCGDYQLAASDFSPWLGAPGLLETPDLASDEEQPEEYCALTTTSDEKEGDLNDPFAVDPTLTPGTAETNAGNHSMSTNCNSMVELTPMSGLSQVTPDASPGQSLQNHSPLIDILSESDELDNDWNIHRELWYGKITQPQEPSESFLHSPPPAENSDSEHPVITRIPRVFPPPAETKKNATASSDNANRHQRSICQAMLSALDQTIADFCPDQLAEQFKQTPSSSPVTDTRRTSRIQQYFGWQPKSSLKRNFQLNYQHFYQQLITSKRYRLLFLQRFRQALKEQEQEVRNNDDTT